MIDEDNPQDPLITLILNGQSSIWDFSYLNPAHSIPWRQKETAHSWPPFNNVFEGCSPLLDSQNVEINNPYF